MPFKNKEELLLWYASFKKQLKEKYDVDLENKMDLVRVGTVTRGRGSLQNEEDTYLQFAFMRMDGERKYLVPEPMPTDREMVDLAILDIKAQPQRYEPKGEDEPDYLKMYEEMRQEIFRKRDKWAVANQFVPDPTKEEDLIQIERLHDDVLNGCLFIYSKDGDVEKSHTVYENDAGELCEGDAIGGGNVKWKPGAVIDKEQKVFSTANDMYENHLRSADQIRGDHLKVKYEADKKWMDEHFPDMVFLTPEEEQSLHDNAINTLMRKEPKPVPAPGFWSWVKKLFGNTRDYDRYNEYREKYAEWREKVDTWTTNMDKKKGLMDQIDRKLIEEDDVLPDVSDPKRKVKIIQNASLVAGAYSTCYSNRVDGMEKTWNTHPKKPEDFDPAQMGMTIRKALNESVKDMMAHPECYKPNGSLTTFGKRYFKLKAEYKPDYDSDEEIEEIPQEEDLDQAPEEDEPEYEKGMRERDPSLHLKDADQPDVGEQAKANRQKMDEKARATFFSALHDMQHDCVGSLSVASANGLPVSVTVSSLAKMMFLNHVDDVLKSGTEAEKETLYKMNGDALNESFDRYMKDPAVEKRLEKLDEQKGLPVNELFTDGNLADLQDNATLPAEEYGEAQAGLLNRLSDNVFPRSELSARDRAMTIAPELRPDVSRPEDPRVSAPTLERKDY